MSAEARKQTDQNPYDNAYDGASGVRYHYGFAKWWYRIAQNAGLVSRGTLSGLNMHQARHAFAMELRRVAGIEAASQALGHSDLSTTLGIYGHQDSTDLERAMDRYAAWLGEEEDE